MNVKMEKVLVIGWEPKGNQKYPNFQIAVGGSKTQDVTSKKLFANISMTITKEGMKEIDLKKDFKAGKGYGYALCDVEGFFVADEYKEKTYLRFVAQHIRKVPFKETQTKTNYWGK